MNQFQIKSFCIYILFLISVCFIGCKNTSKKEKTADIVTSWIGKKIVFPVGTQCSVLGINSPCNFDAPKPYKILLYTDSNGCTSCKLRIDEWKNLIKEADTTMTGKVDFVFYFYPKNNHVLEDLLRQENFRKQVYIDKTDELNRINDLPKSMDYQCFLLDKDDKVLLIGNPTLNQKIWKMDEEIILGKMKPNSRL